MYPSSHPIDNIAPENTRRINSTLADRAFSRIATINALAVVNIANVPRIDWSPNHPASQPLLINFNSELIHPQFAICSSQAKNSIQFTAINSVQSPREDGEEERDGNQWPTYRATESNLMIWREWVGSWGGGGWGCGFIMPFANKWWWWRGSQEGCIRRTFLKKSSVFFFFFPLLAPPSNHCKLMK